MIVIQHNWKNIWRLARMLMTQLGMILPKLFRNIGTVSAKSPLRNVLGYEFGIDIGDYKPLCCKKPAYGIYELKIFMDQVQQLLANGWPKWYKGPGAYLIVISDKPHQEHDTNIDNFIRRICISYRKLNGVTKPFQWPIPKCDNSVTVLNVWANCIWIITLDAHQGYHQLAVRPADH